jgi:hypothetical protein
MRFMKSTIFVFALISIAFGLHACGGSGSSSGDSPQESGKVYSLTVTDVNLVRTAGRQPVPVGPLPASGAEITIK